MLTASITSGQLITRTGRYKHFPIIGTAVAAIGLLLLSGLDADTSTVEAGLFMLILGLGLGRVMQVLVLAVQNAVPYAQLGVATSAATLFRSIGGSLGTAILGAIFSSRLANELAGALPLSRGAEELSSGQIDPAHSGPAGRAARRLHQLVHRLAVAGLPDRGGGGRGRLSALVAPGGARCASRSRTRISARPSPRPATATHCARSRAS